MPSNFYQILGVDSSADPESIKQAYRSLARQYHPDRNKEEGAEERFKEINRAYETLSDPARRLQYDRYGDTASAPGFNVQIDFEPEGNGFAGTHQNFSSKFNQRKTRPTPSPQRGKDLETSIKIELLQAATGQETTVKIERWDHCPTCLDNGQNQQCSKSCSTCHGTGQVQNSINTPFGSFAPPCPKESNFRPCPDCQTGTAKLKPCEKCRGKGQVRIIQRLKLEIPPGVDHGTRLRISEKGDIGKHGGKAGDLYVKILVKAHPEFKRSGTNVSSEVNLSYLQALLGTTIVVPTLYGTAALTIPSCTQPNTHLTLSQQGLPSLGNSNQKGDQIIKVNVHFPDTLSVRERQLLQALAEGANETH